MHLYVHIPFCHRICPYCAFFKHTPASTDMKLFIRALAREAESRAAALSMDRGGETATLYFGGGTPSMLSDTHLGRLMETLDRLVPVDRLDEFSFEANPATFTEKKVRFWRSLGMNRVSLGVQSLDARILHLLGREHTPSAPERTTSPLTTSPMRKTRNSSGACSAEKSGRIRTKTRPTLNWRKPYWKRRACAIMKPPTTPGKAAAPPTTWLTGKERTTWA